MTATFTPNPLKKGMGTQVVKEVLRNNYQTCNLIGPYHFWGISPRSLSPDCFSPGGAHGLGMRLVHKHSTCAPPVTSSNEATSLEGWVVFVEEYLLFSFCSCFSLVASNIYGPWDEATIQT